MVGVAVKVIAAEPHIEVELADTLTEAVTFGFTVATTAVLVAVVQPLFVAST